MRRISAEKYLRLERKGSSRVKRVKNTEQNSVVTKKNFLLKQIKIDARMTPANDVRERRRNDWWDSCQTFEGYERP